MAKRSNNEGTIFRIESGCWRAQLVFGGKRRSHTAKTKTECQEWINNNKPDPGEIAPGQDCKQTLETYLTFWLNQIELVVRPSTIYQYRLYCDRYIFPALGKIRLGNLRLNIIQELYTTLHNQGHGVRTIKVTHNVIHHALEDAVNSGAIYRNPAKGAKLPKAVQKEMKFYEEDQVSQLLLSARGDRYEALYHLAIATGLRQSEILGLRVE